MKLKILVKQQIEKTEEIASQTNYSTTKWLFKYNIPHTKRHLHKERSAFQAKTKTK